MAGPAMNQAIRIVEPLGERAAALPLEVGGEGAGLVVPGASGSALSLVASGRQWLAQPAADGARVTLNGVLLRTAQPLADGDVIGVGEAQVTVRPGAALVEVMHLAGNATVAPLRQDALPGEEIIAGVHEVVATAEPANVARPATVRRAGRWLAAAAAAAVLLAVLGLLFMLVPVPLQLTPEGARVQAAGPIDWQSGERIFLLPGRRQIEISHPGYRNQLLTLDVTRALASATPLPVTLDYLPGIVEVDTGGVEAELLVDGQVAGKVPGEVEIEAGARDLILRAPRHVDHVARVEVSGGGERQQLTVQLQSAIGFLVLDTIPAGAMIVVDGQALGTAPQRLELDAGLRQLALSAPGRRSWNSEVAIIAGQTLDLGRVDLTLPPALVMRSAAERQQAEDPAATTDPSQGSAESAPPAAPRPPPPSRVNSPLLGSLVLLPAGEYLQGSERREQGRRSNEVQRKVRLTRPFYLGATEVSNAQFRAFRPTHVAGIAQGFSLDLDTQAVSRVSWNDAVEFCNWLSLREGLPVAYERREGRWQLVQPLNHGYRLPTEAEWEYAARYVDGQRWQRFAWGDALPPPANAANIAGEETLPAKPGADAPSGGALPQYRDEHPVIAPVGSYARSPAGLFDMGGNVSEWMHDVFVSLPEAVEVTDPMGAASDGPHAVRGGNWRSSAIAGLRAAWRERATTASQVIGFRVARFAEGATP